MGSNEAFMKLLEHVSGLLQTYPKDTTTYVPISLFRPIWKVV